MPARSRGSRRRTLDPSGDRLAGWRGRRCARAAQPVTRTESPPTTIPAARPRRRRRASLLAAALGAALLAGAAPSAGAPTGGVEAPPGAAGEPAAPGPASTPAAPAPKPKPAEGARPPKPAPPAAPPARVVRVSIARRGAGRPVPPGFLGLSFEVGSLAQIGRLAQNGNLVALLRSLGPGVLRFGGVSADDAIAWTDALTPRPAWARGTIGPQQMEQLGTLAQRTGWRVLLTVGLAHYEPLAAAREVAAAHRALGPYLEAVEIGNEPDAYGHHGLREAAWSAQTYEEEVTGYREAIAALTPGVAIAGPDISGSAVFPEWGRAEAHAQSPLLLTGHHYPLGCRASPSIAALLSAPLRGREARSLTTYLSVARRAGVPLRIDEANSVSCGGVAGISDTFASALWAAGYVAQAMDAGAAGVNFEGNPTNCRSYTPLCAEDSALLATGTMSPRPEWYALLLTRALIGWRPLPTAVASRGRPDLVAAAFATRSGALQLLFVDDEAPGSPPLALRVPVGGGLRTASVATLSAPSRQATEGVQLDGRAVAADGSFSAPAQLPVQAVRGGVLGLTLAPSSAELVSVPAPGR